MDRSRLAGSPTVETLAASAAGWFLHTLAGLLGLPGLLALSLSWPLRPWTLLTSVYAHASLGHLLMNALGLLLVGFAVERATSRARFHAFVVTTGALAGLAEVAVGGLLGRPVAVLGASGAVLALFGYLLAGNAAADTVLGRLDLGRRAKVALVALAALVVTLATAGPGVALVAHFVGFTLGLVAGRLGVLRV